MQFAAAFLEYLVTGCGGLLWVIPLFNNAPLELGKLEKVEVALLFPLVYVLGMMIDFVSVKLVSRFKNRIRRDLGAPKHDIPSTAFIAWHSAELSREFQVRSSRDRIARGATLNMLLLALVALLRPSTPAVLHLSFGRPLAVLVFLGVAALCFAIWWRCEYLSSNFKRQAVDTIIKHPKGK